MSFFIRQFTGFHLNSHSHTPRSECTRSKNDMHNERENEFERKARGTILTATIARAGI